jgi:hypothetical protein
MLREAGHAPFCSVAAKIMSIRWKAILHGAVDAGATATVHKLAVSVFCAAST